MLGTTALGKYQILRPLGQGSNAEVHLAHLIGHPAQRVVVKRIHPHVVEHPKFRQLFDAEVRSMAKFNHPYAVRLLEASLDDPLGPCLVMEYVPGLTLEAILTRHKRLPIERVGRLLGFLCHALQAAHEAGIIHRDLKPANLMVADAGTPAESLKVMDFGFAGFANKPHLQLAELTGQGPIDAIGTPEYVSPEMIRGDTVDGRSDLYSVGVILFEMLTGRLPFDHRGEEKVLAAHIKETPPRFHKIGCKDISPAVEGVVQLALSKFANERPQTAHELVEAFELATFEKIWPATAPEDYDALRRTPVIQNTPAPRTAPYLPPDPFRISHSFDVILPERLAAAKLRGFVEDYSGDVTESEPGFIRIRLGVPRGYRDSTSSPASSIFGWLGGLRKPSVQAGQEPIEVELRLDKPEPHTAKLRVGLVFRPLKAYIPKETPIWQTRCDNLYTRLRQYLGA